jgi:hypothetical protein
MGEIRSSWEMAQEKADRIGNLSSEERTRQKEEQYRSTAAVLVHQYFSDHDIRPVEKELSKYAGEDRELLKRMLLDGFLEAIDLDEHVSFDMVLRGLHALSGKEEAGHTIDAIKQLYNVCREDREKEKQHAEDIGRQVLLTMGISGNAIGRINIYARDEWLSALNNIDANFKKQLASLKEDMFK